MLHIIKSFEPLEINQVGLHGHIILSFCICQTQVLTISLLPLSPELYFLTFFDMATLLPVYQIPICDLQNEKVYDQQALEIHSANSKLITIFTRCEGLD